MAHCHCAQNRSKNPLLISPTWIVSFVALEMNGTFFFLYLSVAFSLRFRSGETTSEKIELTRDMLTSAEVSASVSVHISMLYVYTM